MKYNKNWEQIQGRIYQHDLAIKTVQNSSSANYGKEFINGTIEVAVDDEILNVIPVHFTYVTEVTSKGNPSSTYTALKQIINSGKTILNDGTEEATIVSITGAIALNDFYSQNNELVSTKVNEGSFVSILSEMPAINRNRWEADMLITGYQEVEADEEKDIPVHAIVNGAIFNFRGALLPVQFTTYLSDGMAYFASKAPTGDEPLYTKVWGEINCKTKTTVVNEESAFGEPAVKTYTNKTKEWTITGCASEALTYDFGEEDVLTREQVEEKMQDREVYLADVKQRAEDYRASKAAAATTSKPADNGPKPSTVKSGTFNF